MRRYSILTMLLITAGILFYALHEYVEITAVTHAQAQAEPPAIENDAELEAEDCGNGHCFPTKTSEDKNNNTNLSKEQIVAKYLRASNKKQKGNAPDGDQ